MRPNGVQLEEQEIQIPKSNSKNFLLTSSNTKLFNISNYRGEFKIPTLT